MREGLTFQHETLAQRVLFGAGDAGANLRQEFGRRSTRKAMVIATARELARTADLVEGLPVATVYDDVQQHVPVENAERARRAATRVEADLLVCIGGGSSVGLAKAIALTSALPIVAIPTTYAGSEATDVWGLTEGGIKTTGTDPRVLPATVIYDSTLTLSLPVSLSVVSGLNALAHCVDSLWAPKADPINKALATEGMRALARALPAIAEDPQGLYGRDEALYGAYLSAVAFASAGSGMHHKICHVLGGRFNLPHAETHAVVLSHVLAFNAPAAQAAAKRIAEALGADDAVQGLAALGAKLEAPRALKDLGLAEAELEEAATLILPKLPVSNPRPVTRPDLLGILRAAWSGEPAS